MNYVINIFFASELIRRFFFQESFILLILPEAVVCVLGAYYLVKTNVRIALPLLSNVFFVLMIAGMALSLFFVSFHPVIFLLALRSIVVPAFAILVAIKNPPENAKWLIFWLVVALGIALVQIALGPDHPFSTVKIAKFGSIQTFAESEYVQAGVRYFRPTSIFMHVAKYGQASFALFCILWGFWASGLIKRHALLGIGLSIVNLVISGQRSGVFLAVIVVLATVTHKMVKRRLITKMVPAFAFVLAIIMAVGLSGVRVPFWGAFYDRYFVSGSGEVSKRTEKHVLEGFELVFVHYLFVGEGPGTLSLGSERFGSNSDAFRRSIMRRSGVYNVTIEGSYLRYGIESGGVNLLWFMAFLISIVVYNLRCVGDIRRRVFAMVLISIMLWALHHDTFGNAPALSVILAGFWDVLATDPSREIPKVVAVKRSRRALVKAT